MQRLSLRALPLLLVHALGALAICCGYPLQAARRPRFEPHQQGAVETSASQNGVASARTPNPDSVSHSGLPSPSRPPESLAGDEPGEGPNTEVANRSPPLRVTWDALEIEGARARPAGAVAGAVFDEQLQWWNIGGRRDPDYISSRSGYHPGTRVRVDATIRAVRSKANLTLANRIQAGLRNHGYWLFRNCYEDAARERPSVGGKTWLRMTLGADGAVLGTRLIRTDVSDRAIAACHAKAARRIRIEMTRRRRVDVDVMVAVWPGDVPLLPLPPAPTPLEPWHPTLAAERDVLTCFEEARARDPMLWGRMALSFSVDDQGRAREIREYQSQFGDPTAVACVSTYLASLVFPQPPHDAPRFVAAWRLHPAEPEDTERPEPGDPRTIPRDTSTP